MIRVLFLSDTHCQLNKVNIPSADICLHMGDWSYRGNIEEITEFNYHCGLIKNKFKYGIFANAGNHDFLLANQPYLGGSLITNFRYVKDELIEVAGLKIYMSPYTPTFGYWAFMRDRGRDIAEIWSQIPTNLDILCTHGPPYGILDKTPNGEHVGCEELLKRTNIVVPKVHAFGHIHNGFGNRKQGGILFINASVCNERYKPVNPPTVVDFDETTKEYKIVKDELIKVYKQIEAPKI